MKLSTNEPEVNSKGLYKVDFYFYNELKRIVELKPWRREEELIKFLNELSPIQQRTPAQNRGLYLFLTQLAEALNLAGLGMKKVLKESVDIDWTTSSAKEYLWKPIQKAICGTDSTTELEKQVDIDKVHETLMKHLGEKFGVEYIEFPSEKKEEVKEEIEYPDYQGEPTF
jgi:hypothetical protein